MARRYEPRSEPLKSGFTTTDLKRRCKGPCGDFKLILGGVGGRRNRNFLCADCKPRDHNAHAEIKPVPKPKLPEDDKPITRIELANIEREASEQDELYGKLYYGQDDSPMGEWGQAKTVLRLCKEIRVARGWPQ